MITIPTSTIEWLLSEENPSVRYLSLKNLLDRSENDKEIIDAKRKINNYHVIKKILKHNKKFWGEDRHLYRKYKGGYWQLIFLSDFHADGSHPDIKYGCEFVLNDKKWQEWLRKEWGHCLASNILRSLVTLGFGSDIRVSEGILKLAELTVRDKGIDCEVMDYSVLPLCFMALPKLLKALNVSPVRNEIVKEAKNIIIENLLENEIYRYVPEIVDKWNKEVLGGVDQIFKEDPNIAKTKKEYILRKKGEYLEKYAGWKTRPKPGWLKFGYPMHYNSNILESLTALADAGVKYDERLKEALSVVIDSADIEFKWKMSFSLNGKMWINIEQKGKPSRWITYFALKVLKHFEGIEISG
jgi:hypothetical protein